MRPRRQGTYFLKASLTFSPASLRLAFAWSALPSFSVLLSPVNLPTASLALPIRFWALFFALSIPLTVSTPPSRGRPSRPWVPHQPESKRQAGASSNKLALLAHDLACLLSGIGNCVRGNRTDFAALLLGCLR